MPFPAGAQEPNLPTITGAQFSSDIKWSPLPGGLWCSPDRPALATVSKTGATRGPTQSPPFSRRSRRFPMAFWIIPPDRAFCALRISLFATNKVKLPSLATRRRLCLRSGLAAEWAVHQRLTRFPLIRNSTSPSWTVSASTLWWHLQSPTSRTTVCSLDP